MENKATEERPLSRKKYNKDSNLASKQAQYKKAKKNNNFKQF